MDMAAATLADDRDPTPNRFNAGRKYGSRSGRGRDGGITADGPWDDTESSPDTARYGRSTPRKLVSSSARISARASHSWFTRSGMPGTFRFPERSSRDTEPGAAGNSAAGSTPEPGMSDDGRDSMYRSSVRMTSLNGSLEPDGT